MRVIFLDIDGVLNSVSSFIYNNRLNLLGLTKTFSYESMCPIACSNLQYVLEECPDTKLVISSTWRKYNTLEELKDKFQKNLISSDRVIGVTPVDQDGYRGTEIQSYLDCNPEVTTFVILDDDQDMKPYMNKLVRVDSKNGFTFIDAEKLIQKLGEDNGKEET